MPTYERYLAVFDVDTQPAITNIDKLLSTTRAALAQIRSDVASGTLPPGEQLAASRAVTQRAESVTSTQSAPFPAYGEPPGEDASDFQRKISAYRQSASERARISQQLLEDPIFKVNSATSQSNNARTGAEVNTLANRELIKYADVLGESIATEEQKNAAVRSASTALLLQSEQYKADTVTASINAERTKAEITNRTNSELRQYAGELAESQLSQERLKTATDLAANNLLIDQRKVLPPDRDASGRFVKGTFGRENPNFGQPTPLGQEVLGENAAESTGKQRLALEKQLEQNKLVTQRDIEQRAQATAERKAFDAREQVELQGILEADEKLRANLAEAAVAAGRVKALQQVETAGRYTDTDRGTIAIGASAEKVSSAEQNIANNQALLENASVLGQESASRKALNDTIKLNTLAQEQNVSVSRDSEGRLTVKALADGENALVTEELTSVERQAIIAVLNQSRAVAVATETTRLNNEISEESLKAEALLSLEKKAYAEKLRIAQRQVIQSNPELAAAFNEGTGFQKLLARLRTTSTGNIQAASDQPNLTQYVGQQALRTATFAASGIAFFGAFQGIKTLLDTSKELQVTFASIQQQFDDLGQGNQFGKFKQDILDLSADTGTSAQEIATVALQLKGFFGDTDEAIQGTTAAIQFAKVTGQSLGETVNALTAIAADYNAAAEASGQKAKSNVQIFDDVTNSALGIQERFGVLAKDTVSFLGDFAPVAAQYGVTLKQAEAIAGVYQQASGRSGSSGAEQFNRILPSIESAQVALVTLNQQVLGFGSGFDKALAQGNYGAVLDELIKKWGTLDKSTQNYLLTLLGGSRNAQALVTLGNLSSKYVDELNKPVGDDAGKRAKYFQNVQDTLSTTLDRLGQSVKKIGLEIFDSGLGTALQDLAEITETLANALGILLQGFNSLPGPIKTVFTQAAALLLIMKGLSALGELSFVKGLAGGALSSGLGTLAPGAILGGAEASTLLPGGLIAGGAAGAAGAGLFGNLGAGIGAALPVLAPVAAAYATAKAITSVKEYNDSVAKQSQSLISQYQDNHVSDTELQKRIDAQPDRIPLQAPERFRIPFTDVKVHIPTPANYISDHLGFGPTNPAKVALEDVQQLRKSQPEAQGLIKTFGSGKDSELAKLLQTYKDQAGASSNAQDLSVDQIKEFAKHGTKDDQDSKNLEAFVYYANQRNGLVNQIIDDIKTQNKTDRDNVSKTKKISGDKGEKLDTLNQSLQDVIANYQTGDARAGDVLKAYDTEIETYEALARLNPSNPAFSKKLQQDQAAQAKFYASAVDTVDKNIRDITQATTGKEDFRGEINEDINKLRDPKYTSPSARQANIGELFSLYGKVYQELGANATTFAQTLALSQNGLKIDPAAGREAVRQSLVTYNLQWREFIDGVKETGSIGDGFTNEVIAFAQKYNISVGDAARKIITDRIQILKATIDVEEASGGTAADLNALYKQLDGLNAALAGVGNKFKDIKVPSKVVGPSDLSGISAEQSLKDAQSQGDPQQIADDQVAAANEQIKALNSNPYYKNPANRGEYQKALNDAKIQLLQGTTAQGDALSAIAEANAGLVEAENQYDPITAARAQLDSANAQLANAHGTAARLQAQAAIVNANHAIQDAIEAQAHAETDLIVAIANSHGQTVKAAQLSEQSAEQDVRELIARGAKPGSAPLLEAQAKTVDAIAAVERARVSDKESTIEFNLSVKKISTAQAIAQYRTLLASADVINLGKQTQQDLQQKIYDLKHSLESDLQFNLPTDIQLPTLYEAKRINQDPNSYQDNRTITITLTANDKLSARQATDTMIAEVNKPPRSGPRAKTY